MRLWKQLSVVSMSCPQSAVYWVLSTLCLAEGTLGPYSEYSIGPPSPCLLTSSLLPVFLTTLAWEIWEVDGSTKLCTFPLWS